MTYGATVTFLGGDAAAWAAFGVWAQAFVIAVSAVFVLGQVREARRLREDQSRPFVVASITVEQTSLLMITIENIGTTPAFDVALDTDPTPALLHGEKALRVLHRPTPVLPPGHRIRTYWDNGFTILDDDYEHPQAFRVAVTYHNGRDRDAHRAWGPEHYVLDALSFAGQASDLKGLHEAAKALEKIATTMDTWTRSRPLRVETRPGEKSSRALADPAEPEPPPLLATVATLADRFQRYVMLRRPSD